MGALRDDTRVGVEERSRVVVRVQKRFDLAAQCAVTVTGVIEEITSVVAVRLKNPQFEAREDLARKNEDPPDHAVGIPVTKEIRS